jgi:hypothetical protein
MDPDQLLQSLGLTLGLPNLSFDSHGCARVVVDGAPALDFERQERMVHVYSVLGLLPPEGRETLYAQMLQGNLFGASTAGAALSIDELQGEVVLCRTFVAESTSAHSFASDVEAFVAAAEDWQARIAGSASDAPVAASLAAPGLLNHFLRG